jgi:hypothetical protein
MPALIELLDNSEETGVNAPYGQDYSIADIAYNRLKLRIVLLNFPEGMHINRIYGHTHPFFPFRGYTNKCVNVLRTNVQRRYSIIY